MSYLPTYQETGAGPALVFLHGIGGNRFSFDWQFPAFQDKWRCIAWDMPGYGGSPLPGEGLSFEAMSGALANLLDHLGEDRITLLGHSMGGFVAQDFTARYPGRVSALILSATSPAFGKPGGDWQEQFLASRLAPLDAGQTPADFAPALMAKMFPATGKEAALAKAIASNAELPAETYRAALNCIVGFDGRDDLANIACPTYLLAASEDETAPAKVMERMAAKIPGSRYHCLPGLNHLPNIEDADAYNAALGVFLNSLEQ